MKTITIILLILSVMPSIGNAQTIENIFTIQSGKVISNPNWIDPLFEENPISPEVFIYQEKIVSKDAQSEYQISLYNYQQDILDKEAGIFRIIKIKKGDKELLKLAQADPWDTIPKRFTNSSIKYFITVPLTQKTTALLFTGHIYPNDPGLLTIVVLNGEEATLVYNKPMYLIEISNNATSFSTYVADGFIQYFSGDDNNISRMDTETLPYKYHIWSENGLLKIQNLGKITKEFL